MEGARPDQDLPRSGSCNSASARGWIGEIEADVRRRVDEATEKCKVAPMPSLDILTTDVYADGGFAWRELTYRDAVARGIAQEMARDPDVVFLGEDVAKAGGGVQDDGRAARAVRAPAGARHADFRAGDPGRRHGAAMTGLKPIAEIMFSDFFAVCFDYIANEFGKSRYMTNGQVKCPLVVRTGNGAGSRLWRPAQPERRELVHDDSGLKVVAPSNPRDVIGFAGGRRARSRSGDLLRAQIAFIRPKGEVPDGEIVDTSAPPRSCAPAATRPFWRWP